MKISEKRRQRFGDVDVLKGHKPELDLRGLN
jgi:hypothetical protein